MDNNMEYVREVALKIISGEMTDLTIDALHCLLIDPTAPSLKSVCTKSARDMHRDNESVSEYKTKSMQDVLEKAWSGAYSTPSTPSPHSVESEEDDDAEEGDEVGDTSFLVWNPTHKDCLWEKGYKWFNLVFFRVNGSEALRKTVKDPLIDHKVRKFQNAHLKMIQLIDSLEYPSDVNLGEAFWSLYERLGPSKFKSDTPFVKVERTKHQLQPRPLEVITTHLPNLVWKPEIHYRDPKFVPETHFLLNEQWCPIENISFETHRMYYCVVAIVNQCRRELQKTDDITLKHALWVYYCSFVDFFCCPRFDDNYLFLPLGTEIGRNNTAILTDRPVPWNLFGTADNRTFHAGDLPDFYHTLVSIPLWGEQKTPSFFLGKIYQKALPFACQRRHLTTLIVKHMNENIVFWKVFQKLFWVMLANLYPGELMNTNYFPSMQTLMKMKHLVESKDATIAALPQPKKDSGAPLIVLTIFRLHILYMASFNDQYVNHAKQLIDWDYFKKDVLKLADIIQQSNFFTQDPFMQARKQLSKTIKNPNAQIHRLKKHSMALTITSQLNEMFEKTILKNKQNFALDLQLMKELTPSADESVREAFFEKTIIGGKLRELIHGELPTGEDFVVLFKQVFEIAENAQAFYKRILNAKYKSDILNALIRIPPEQRMTRAAFNILAMHPEDFHGASISAECVELLCQLVQIYHGKAGPKDFRKCIGQMNMPHFMMICFYFNMVAILQQINFVVLDADYAIRTHQAMCTVRYALFPGQQIPDSMYDVTVAPCCGKICTQMGVNKYGNENVAYNIEKESFVCANGRNMRHESDDEDDDEDNDDEDEDEDEEDVDMTRRILETDNHAQQEAQLLASLTFVPEDLVADASRKKGKGAKRTLITQRRKAIRNERKAFNKIPCGQPVITFSLKGRALIWGNKLEKQTQIMFCPSCGALHIYTILNYSESEMGLYRCNECARKELTHTNFASCIYCKKVLREKNTNMLEICDPTDPNPEMLLQKVYFCNAHFRIAQANRTLFKKEMWKRIKTVQDAQNLQHARGKK